MIFPKIAVVTGCVETALTYVRDYSEQYHVMVVFPTKLVPDGLDVSDVVLKFRSAGVQLFVWSDISEHIVVRYRHPRKSLCYYYLVTDFRGDISVYSVLATSANDFINDMVNNDNIAAYVRIGRKSAYGFASIAGKSPDKYFIFYPPAT